MLPKDRVRTARATAWISCRCGAHWSGEGRCHCAACHLTFSTLSAFDKHRHEFTCCDPESVGLVARTKKVGRYKYVVWGWAGTWTPDA